MTTKLILLATILLSTNAFGQTLPGLGRLSKNPGVTVNSNANDTTLKVVYITKTSHSKLPAYYVNGTLVNKEFLFSINPKLIADLWVNKETVQIGNSTYHGQLYLTTSKDYSPKFISLTELKEKYNILKGEPAIFIMDGEIVTSDYDKFIVDENLLLRIFIDKVENSKEKINIKYIKLLTRTKENIKKVNEFRIRGTEVALTK